MAGLERFSAKEEAAVRELVARAERSYDPMVFSDMLAEVSKQFRKHPLRFVEGELRRLNSGLFLIANPMTPDIRKHYDATMPHTGNTQYPFGLAYFMGESDMWHAQLQAYGATPALNQERLDSTGFLTVKRGSALARWAQAGYN